MPNFKVTWTGESCRHSGLLYQDYQNRAEVRDAGDGSLIGVILHLPNGYYRPTYSQIRGDDCMTADEAARAVVALMREFAPKART